MDRKTHYKLYKGGKNWLCMAIATLSVAMGGCFTSSSAQADTNNQPQATSTVVATSALTSSVTNEASSAEAQSAIVEAAENTSDNK
ncbi:KxYKxGKxW signal peptide domain-containing protein [Limosilactobacillus vaginalis]|uniref:KxYKxGKxW signal peptide domain-containing protein n=2 Tax=Limosilactobacillus vaginalis TaxID=1633 RepID=A0AAW5WV32_9LACO|nr:KxYKxGKxW signal peptide domain-containing protein [Limosilactobacillus vaginalis]MCZ3668264.1 KxYKxGKxW signal peptide domain-containing protein [Limosilactobacillus vaginalis]